MILSSTHDFREAARRRIPRFLFDYADGGANCEITLRSNVEDLERVRLRQRVLQGASEINLQTTLFGRVQSLPIALGPVGIAGMYSRRGECQAARAANGAGVPFCLSTVSLCSLSEVADVAGSEHSWFQLYVLRDRGFMRDLLAVARERGAKALVFTVDMPVPGSRYRDAHSGMSGQYAALRRVVQSLGKPRWSWDVAIRGRPHVLGNLEPLLGQHSGLNDYIGWLAANFDPTIRWTDLDWIRAEWPHTLIIKGVLDPDDARAAADLGAEGIVVSNHGGRQLDGVLSTARALPPVVDAVGDKVTVLVDSGVRSGLDVLRMMALGAKGVLLGRAWVFALAAQGEAGVRRLLDLMAKEMRVAMTLAGARTLREVGRHSLADTSALARCQSPTSPNPDK